MMNPSPLISIEGEPFERGRQYGVKAKKPIIRNLKIYRTLFRRHAKLTWGDILKLAGDVIPFIEEYDEDIMEEIRGISSGAGVTVRDIIALNSRYDILPSSTVLKALGGCTSFAATGEATSSGHLLMGQNWDFRFIFKESCVLLHVRQTDGKPDILTHVEAGLVGHRGINSTGLGLCVNALFSRDDAPLRPGTPLISVVSRGILNSKSLDEALNAVDRAERVVSINFLVGRAGEGALDFEVTPGRISVLRPHSGLIAHANNFLSEEFASSDLAPKISPSSPARYSRAMEIMLSECGKIGVKTLKRLTRDHSNHPYEICRHPDLEADEYERAGTVKAIIMDLDEGKLWVSDGPPCMNEYRTLIPFGGEGPKWGDMDVRATG